MTELDHATYDAISLRPTDAPTSAKLFVGGATAPADRFEALDALRGICATLVAMHHFSAYSNADFWRLSFVRNSYLFVDFFFVLSGFVVCHAYGARIRTAKSFLGFMVRRFGRLWPLHIAVLLALLIFVAVVQALPHPPFMHMVLYKGSKFSIGKLLLSAMFLSAHHIGEMGWNQPSWSISAEFSAYILFGVVCLAGRRALLPIAIALVGIALVILALKSKTYLNTTSDFGLMRCIVGFFIGVVTYVCYTSVPKPVALSRSLATGIECVFILFAILYVTFVGEGPFENNPSTFAAPFVFAFVVLTVAFGQGAVAEFLVRKPLLWLGQLSYSIYMLHWPMFIATGYVAFVISKWVGNGSPFEIPIGRQDYILALHPPLLADGMAIALCVAVIALSGWTYKIIEAPGRTAFNRIARRIESRALG